MNKLKQIPIEQLMEILLDVYESGYDFIDIEGYSDEKDEQDVIKISIREEYHFENTSGDDDDVERVVAEKNILSEEDINKLL
jgi:molybdopterin-guanine dinucleotide biosynthesis protein